MLIIPITLSTAEEGAMQTVSEGLHTIPMSAKRLGGTLIISTLKFSLVIYT